MNYRYKVALSFATEEQNLVEEVYHYLKAENLSVFFAPAPECQAYISGKNQRVVFYDVFGLKSEYVALFVSKNYVVKKVPIEEAGIALAKHDIGNVIPIYLDGTPLPGRLFDPKETNYFKSDSPSVIASHLAAKIKGINSENTTASSPMSSNSMNIDGNIAEKQIFIQTLNGSIEL